MERMMFLGVGILIGALLVKGRYRAALAEKEAQKLRERIDDKPTAAAAA